MSLVSAILFNAPPPVFHGDVRKIIAREMVEKAIKSKGLDAGKGNYDEGKRNRSAIVQLLAGGNVYKLADIACAANISVVTARRHLLDLVNKKVAMTNVGTVVISRKNPLLFWMEK